jgi:regulatory protein
MDLLARREHSRLELQRKLCLRDFSLPSIYPILDQLEMDKLLSDERFSDAYVRMRSRRGFGPLRIQQALLERGISQELAIKSLQDLQMNWCELARQVYRKKYGTESKLDYAMRVKQAQFLAYRGFSHEQINYALGVKSGIDNPT